MREEMDVRVDSARRGDEPLTRNGFCPCANHQVGVNIIHGKGVARLADACDLAIFNANVSFDDADHGVHHNHIGNHRIQYPLGVCHTWNLPHAVTYALAASIHHLITCGHQTALDLTDEFCVGQAEPVTCGWAKEIDVLFAWYRFHFRILLPLLLLFASPCQLSTRLLHPTKPQVASTL